MEIINTESISEAMKTANDKDKDKIISALEACLANYMENFVFMKGILSEGRTFEIRTNGFPSIDELSCLVSKIKSDIKLMEKLIIKPKQIVEGKGV